MVDDYRPEVVEVEDRFTGLCLLHLVSCGD